MTRLAFVSLAAVLSSVPALAADEIVKLTLGEARLLPLLAAPARIYLDDPSLATLSTPAAGQVLLVPRAAGTTILHALTDDGSAIATIEIDVAASSNAVPHEEATKPIELTLKQGQVSQLPLLAPAERIFVNDPTVVSVRLGVQPAQAEVRGLAPGTTTVYALSAEGTRVGLYRLQVTGTAPPDAGNAAGAVTYPIALQLPEAAEIHLRQPAASIIIDNPAVVGAQIGTSSSLTLFSKSVGSTMIHALDASRRPIAAIRVTVAGGGP